MADHIVTNSASNATSQGFVAELVSGRSNSILIFATVILASSIVFPLLNRFLTPQIDPKEPPLLKPTIPFIGHIIGIIRHQANYHQIIHDANPSYPIATLPMLNGKMYVVYDPNLIQAILKNKIASFEPFATEFAQKTFNLSAEAFEKITTIPGLVADFTDGVHASFQTDVLHRMNFRYLHEISSKLNAIGTATYNPSLDNLGKESVLKQGIEVENLYLWIRHVMSLGTTRSLYGDNDPFHQDTSLIDLIWTFDESLPYFLLSLFPSITLPKAYKARATAQAALKEYYAAEHDINDPTAAQLTINRARVLRKNNFTPKEIAKMEVMLPIAATTNAVPTLYWLILYIFSRPDLVVRVRAEIEGAVVITENDSQQLSVKMNVADFDEKFPLLVSCYRETMRLKNHSISMRRALSDFVVNGTDGQSYLLKKGTDLQLPVGVPHSSQPIWGDKASEFVPDRFLSTPPTSSQDKSSQTSEDDRKRKTAFIPFGGGRHLCPGRNFAFVEIISFACMLVLGFDIEPVGMEFSEMKMCPPLLSSGTAKPDKKGAGLGGRILRRKGWEGVHWDFQ